MGSVFGIRLRLFALTVFLLSLGVAVGYVVFGLPLRSDVEARERTSLEMRLRLAADQLALQRDALDDLPAWEATAKRLAAASETRVHLARQDGSFVADSEVVVSEASTDAGSGASVRRAEQEQALSRGLGGRMQETENGPVWHWAAPWLHAGQVVGTVTLSARPQAVLAVERALTRGSALALLAALAAGAGIALVASSLATAPARLLTEVAKRMAAGELSARSEAQGTDEFAQLSSALNGLAGSLSRTLDELRAEKARLDRVLASMTEGVLLVAADGKVQLVNSALLEMLSIPPNPVGKDAGQVLDNAQVLSLLEEAPEGEHHTAELSLVHVPMRKILASVRRLPHDTGVLAVFVDVTEQRRLETVRQEFVSNASHELRTPIAAIMSAVETLQSIDAVKGDAERGFMDMIARNALRLKALVDDLLALSHLESGAVEVQLEPMRLRSCVEAIMNDLAPSARQRGTELICLVRSNLTVMASQRGLQHVIGNLIDNAIKYCPPRSRVTVEAHAEDSVAVISVSDNGPGIPEVHRDRIFERFYRIDAGRSRALGGTGLGLSIVKHWVEAMGGTIRVAAGKTGGTEFRVALALNADKTANDSRPNT